MTSSADKGQEEATTAAQVQVKAQLLSQLDSLVQQCESRYSNRYELATEYEVTVANLCRCLEAILGHGFRRQPMKTSSKLKILNGFTNSISSSKSSSSGTSSLSYSSTMETQNSSTAQLWHFISQYLTEHEVKRFVSLRNVNTDFGRGRSWLRNALNEHSLEKYLSVILADDDGLQQTTSSSSSSSSISSTSVRRKFYHDWALLLDPQQAPLLITTTKPLSCVLFALSIDRPDLDVEDEPSFQGTRDSQKKATEEESLLKPVVKKNKFSSGGSSGGGGGVQAALVKSRKKKSTVVTINDEEEDLESSDLENGGDMYARSAPVPSFMNLAVAGSSNHLLETHITSNQSKKSPQLSTGDGGALKTSTMVLYPLYDNHEVGGSSSQPSTADISYCDTDTTSESITTTTTTGSSDQQKKVNSDGDNLSPSSLSAANNRLQERIDFLQLEKEKILRDNSLLKIQLNKYLAALELLKYNHSRGAETVSSSDQQKNKDQEGSGDNEVEVYERKLVQVSEMHGELVEFNEHLYRVIQQKDSIIGRLRDELVELRGPLPDNDDLLSLSSEAATVATATAAVDQSLSMQLPLIHVWIPTAFLSGGFKGKSHHIYQIYLRIRDEEWNVYRRYSQFYALHKSLKVRHPTVGGYEFPPKKALGNKDSKVVQERRKKLETWLRNVLNYLQTAGGAHEHLSSKEKLITAVPFLSDKFFLQDRSHSVSDTNLNVSSSGGGGGGGRSSNSRSNTQSTVVQQQPSNHYMGF